MLTIAAGLLISTLALAQADAEKPDDPNKVSNDDPARPIQMPPASTEVKEAFEDFERFSRRSAWERALKALYTIPDDQAGRFVDGEDGFIITVDRRRRDLLAGLPPEGLAAYRLFYDADAKSLYDQAIATSDLSKLERLYSAYFPSAVGDDAADRLGDLYYEQGRFDRAADCWLAILRDRPDTDLEPGLIALKAALALRRSGRDSEYAEILGDLSGRFGGETVAVAGRSGTPRELLDGLLKDLDPRDVETAEASATPLELPDTEVEPAWQFRFADAITAGMTPAELEQWDSNLLSAAVPAATIEGDRLYLNYLGYVLAIDLKSGKLLWRSGSFNDLETVANQGYGQVVDPTRFAILADEARVWSIGRDLKDQSGEFALGLTCRRADGGDIIWRSKELPDYAGIDLKGPPLLIDGVFYVPAGSSSSNGQPERSVLAIRARDGKLLWKSSVATSRNVPYYYYYNQATSEAQPRLLYRAGSILVETHEGIVARLDADTGAVEWGFGYPTAAVESGGGRFIVFGGGSNQQSTNTVACMPPLRTAEGALLIKGADSGRLIAIDPGRADRKWDRPIATNARMLGRVGESLILGGPELSALDLGSRALLWATRLPGGSASEKVVVQPEGIFQLTSRGIFEVDPSNGDVRRTFRGVDTGSVGGDLLIEDRLLLAITNRTVSAYVRPNAPAEAPEAVTGGSE